MEELHVNFTGLTKSFADSKEGAIWKQIIEQDDVIDVELPGEYETKLSIFQKLLVFKILREEMTILAIKKYVKNCLGAEFIESPTFNLKASFQDSTSTTPIIFILSPGADVVADLDKIAEVMSSGENGPERK